MNMVQEQVYTKRKGIVSLSIAKNYWLNYSSQLLYTATVLIRQWCETFHHHDNMRYTGTILSQASTHGYSQLKCQILRVGGYTEDVLTCKWFNYPCARPPPACEVSCLGVPHCCLVRASSRPARQWRRLYCATKRTNL